MARCEGGFHNPNLVRKQPFSIRPKVSRPRIFTSFRSKI